MEGCPLVPLFAGGEGPFLVHAHLFSPRDEGCVCRFKPRRQAGQSHSAVTLPNRHGVFRRVIAVLLVRETVCLTNGCREGWNEAVLLFPGRATKAKVEGVAS